MNQSWRRDYLRYKSYFLNVMGRYRERADIKVYIEILLSLATISVFSIFALRPTLLTIADLIKQIDSKKQTLIKVDEKISNLSKAQILYDQQRSNILLLDFAIPPGPNPDILSRQLEGLSLKYSTSLTKVSIGGASILGSQKEQGKKSEKDLQPFPESTSALDFSVGTKVPIESFTSILGFITDFEDIRRPAKIDRLIINSAKEGDSLLLTLSVDGRAPFYSKSPE